MANIPINLTANTNLGSGLQSARATFQPNTQTVPLISQGAAQAVSVASQREKQEKAAAKQKREAEERQIAQEKLIRSQMVEQTQREALSLQAEAEREAAEKEHIDNKADSQQAALHSLAQRAKMDEEIAMAEDGEAIAEITKRYSEEGLAFANDPKNFRHQSGRDAAMFAAQENSIALNHMGKMKAIEHHKKRNKLITDNVLKTALDNSHENPESWDIAMSGIQTKYENGEFESAEHRDLFVQSYRESWETAATVNVLDGYGDDHRSLISQVPTIIQAVKAGSLSSGNKKKLLNTIDSYKRNAEKGMVAFYTENAESMITGGDITMSDIDQALAADKISPKIANGFRASIQKRKDKQMAVQMEHLEEIDKGLIITSSAAAMSDPQFRQDLLNRAAERGSSQKHLNALSKAMNARLKAKVPSEHQPVIDDFEKKVRRKLEIGKNFDPEESFDDTDIPDEYALRVLSEGRSLIEGHLKDGNISEAHKEIALVYAKIDSGKYRERFMAELSSNKDFDYDKAKYLRKAAALGFDNAVVINGQWYATPNSDSTEKIPLD